ncbi:MAG: hypothetical protein U9R25_06945 [Chloroflexota bacterium]|nr:hypothetical protein [Chloroflexota bacterium]
MDGFFLFVLASIMAIFAVMGYLNGTRWAIISLIVLLIAAFLVERMPDLIVDTFNGIYMGIMLAIKGGLGDVASGDLNSAGAKLESVEPLFSGDSERFALLLVIGFAVAIAVILAIIIKEKSEVFGGILGLFYGYILAAVSIPLIFGISGALFPLPFIRSGSGTGTASATVSSASVFDQFMASLANPDTIRLIGIMIAIAIAIFLFFTVRRGVKR